MTRPYRTLTSVDDVATMAEPPAPAAAVGSNSVVILAALLCALICVLGFISVARWAWLRRGSVADGGRSPSQQSGMKKKMIEVLPKFTYDESNNNSGELCDQCAICLGEYCNGDEIRVLPQCGHRFHVGCVDTWLGVHSSCPSCRQVLVAQWCKKCGESPAVSGGSEGLLEVEDKCRQHNGSSCSSD